MTRSRIFCIRRLAAAAGALVLGTLSAMATLSSLEAQPQSSSQAEDEGPENRVLTPRVGEIVQQALELLDQERSNDVINLLTPLLAERLNAYERFVVFQLRGQARFQLDDLNGTIADFTAMLQTGAATREEANTARVQLGQLHIATNDLDQGLVFFEAAVENGIELNQGFLSLLSRAYYQAERYRDGLTYAELYYGRQGSKSQSDYALMQAYYKQLGQTENEMRVIEAALSDYPETRINWQNLVAILARLEREDDAFEANKLMYLNGLFEECSELFRLSQYFSYYENPYRGATLLEREINTGRCEGDVDQLRTLANMWRQAREFERAIPVLERLAAQTGDGNWYAKLAEAQYELNNLEAAEMAFVDALDIGGLDQTGAVWSLLGTVRFQAGNVVSALAAFAEATRFSESRREAQAWTEFITQQMRIRDAIPLQMEQIRFQECRLIVARELDAATVTSEVDETGRPVIDVPDNCADFFNLYGDQIAEPGS